MKKHTLKSLTALAITFVSISCVVAQNLQISGGNNFSAVVCNQQVVNVTGYNADGQLGVDALGNPRAALLFQNTWTPVTKGTNGSVPMSTAPDLIQTIKQADAGSGGHLLGLDCKKNVWAWGLNDAGQLGRNVLNGTFAERSVPMRVLKGAQTVGGTSLFLDSITYVSGGNNSSFAIEKTTGKVLSWGSNDFGQLGNGTIIGELTPVYVMISSGVPLTNIIQIEGGDDCSYALDASGQMWSWGVTHDGTNAARNIGRSNAGEIVAAAGGNARCMPYAGKVQRGTDNNGIATTSGFLDDIVSISGGDAHALGLDAKGQVWSMGGDWACGQIGQGDGGQYNYKAGRVVDIGTTSSSGPNFLGGGLLNSYKAISIAAGQSSCAIVLQDTLHPTDISYNRVVTFGSNCFYSYNGMIAQSGNIAFTGNMRVNSGTLGRGASGGTAGLPQGTQNENSDATSYEYPVFVKTGAGATEFLNNVTTVSDGDGWYFATDDLGGNAVSWGWNRRGEQGAGDFVDNGYASSLTLPSSCAFDHPCPSQPDLPPNFSKCPAVTQVLDAQVPQIHTTYKYNWQYRATPGAGAWTDIALQGTTSGTAKTTIVTSTDNTTYTAAQTGEIRVLVSDNRPSVAFLCAACPVLKDSVTITAILGPYTFTGCSGTPNSTFTIATPASSSIKWYDAATAGTLLNPSNSNPTITLATTSAPVNAGCGAGVRALFAEDLSSVQGILFSTGALTPTTAQIATGVGCATGSWAASQGANSYLAIRPTQVMKLTSVSFYITNAQAYTVTTGDIEIRSNKLNGGNNEPDAVVYSVASGGSVPVGTNKVIQVTLNYTLAANTIYWIRANGSYNDQPYFNCASAATNNLWNTPVNDNVGGILKAVSGYKDGYGGKGSVFDIKFETGTGYTCSRILVCLNSTACLLPVEMLYFDAKKVANTVALTWGTASEENSDYFNVMRSSDGINWTKIGSVAAKGNSTYLAEYTFNDTNPPSGVVYYKLIEVDKNGASEESGLKKVESASFSTITVLPNPNNGNFNIVVQSNANDALITLTNTIGQTVLQVQEEIKGQLNKEINLTGLAKGVYILSVKTADDNSVVKVIVE